MELVKFSKIQKGTWNFEGERRSGKYYDIHLDEARYGLRINVQIINGSSAVEIRLVKGRFNSKFFEEYACFFAHREDKDSVEACIKTMFKKAQMLFEDAGDEHLRIEQLDDYVIIEDGFGRKDEIKLLVVHMGDDIYEMAFIHGPTGQELIPLHLTGISGWEAAQQIANQIVAEAGIEWWRGVIGYDEPGQ